MKIPPILCHAPPSTLSKKNPVSLISQVVNYASVNWYYKNMLYFILQSYAHGHYHCATWLMAHFFNFVPTSMNILDICRPFSHIWAETIVNCFFSWSSTAIVCSFLLHFGVFCCQLCGRKHTGAKSPLQKIMTVVFMLQDVSTRLYKKKTIGFCINPAELLQLLNQLHHHLICRIIIS